MSHETVQSEVTLNLPERERIFHGLVEVRDHGRDVSGFISEKLMGGARIVVSGEPGVGKTTIIQGAGSALRRNGGIPIFNFYDLNLAAEQKRLGMTTDDWMVETWRRYNERAYNALNNANLIEMPAVGNKDPKDRGVTEFELLCEEAKVERGRDILFIFVTRNYFLQLWSGMLRQRVLEVSPEDVFSVLAKHGLNIEGIERDTDGAIAIRDVFSRAGQKRHMDMISTEESFKINMWLDQQASLIPNQSKDESRNAKTSRLLNQKSEGMIHPPTISEEIIESMLGSFESPTSNKISAYKSIEELMAEIAIRQAVYMEHVFQEVHGFNRDQAIIVHNPISPAPKVLDVNLLQALLD